MTNVDRRAIEGDLPLPEISAEASREKSLRRGHISALHLWWARRPLVACRAAVYAALTPAPADPAFLTRLCQYAVEPETLQAARDQLLGGHGTPPKVLDMFSGGGAIPLEALRLGCAAYALDLNPVAHIVELCTLHYPQRFGFELVDAIHRQALRILERVREEIGDLHPRVRSSRVDPAEAGSAVQPMAYLWARAVRCPDAGCGFLVPLARQTWLCRKRGRKIALRKVLVPDERRVGFEVVSASREEDLDFNPGQGSSRGRVQCPACGTAVSSRYVKAESHAGRLETQFMAAVCRPPENGRRSYVTELDGDLPLPDADAIRQRTEALCREWGVTIPSEPMDPNDANTVAGRGFAVKTWAELFTPRQLLSHLTLARHVAKAYDEMLEEGRPADLAKAAATYLALLVDKVADYGSSYCRWITQTEAVANTLARQAIPMMWDFVEVNPLVEGPGSIKTILEAMLEVVRELVNAGPPATVARGSATALPYENGTFDAVITDPPYYDNISYAVLSDFFYVWLKRTIGPLYPEHFGTELTPKANEAIADRPRHGGDWDASKAAYEAMMQAAFLEAHRVLKPKAPMIVMYAHKTVDGWVTLVDALRRAGFVVTQAWPFHTERPGRLVALGTAALTSSVFLTARKRATGATGVYERDLEPQLAEQIPARVRELFDQGLGGADLSIAAIGTGLSIYTRYARIETEDGDEVSTERYLGDVQRLVAAAILAQALAQDDVRIDPATRFYLLARQQFGEESIGLRDAQALAETAGVEIEALAAGERPLIEIRDRLVSVSDYRPRGEALWHEREPASLDSAPLIDVAHRLLWLFENDPSGLPALLSRMGGRLHELRLVAQVLTGQTMSWRDQRGAGSPSQTPEQQTAARLLAAWGRLANE